LPEAEAKLALPGQKLKIQKTDLMQTQKENEYASDSGKEHLLLLKEGTQGSKRYSKEKEGKRNPKDKKEGMEKDFLLFIINPSVLSGLPGVARQITHIDGNQGNDTGGQEGEQTFQKYKKETDVIGSS
jgi:hypothetical protein